MKKKPLFRKKSRVLTALDQIKCPKEMKQQRLLLTCAPKPKLPSHTSTMSFTVLYIFGPNSIIWPRLECAIIYLTMWLGIKNFNNIDFFNPWTPLDLIVVGGSK